MRDLIWTWTLSRTEGSSDRGLVALLLLVVPFHRALLVGATIGIAISGSRIASDPSEAASWLFLGGCGLFLLLADISRNINEAAGVLAASSGEARSVALRDIYSARGPAAARWLVLIAILLLLAGVILYAIDDGSDHASPRRHATSMTQPGPGSRG